MGKNITFLKNKNKYTNRAYVYAAQRAHQRNDHTTTSILLLLYSMADSAIARMMWIILQSDCCKCSYIGK